MWGGHILRKYHNFENMPTPHFEELFEFVVRNLATTSCKYTGKYVYLLLIQARNLTWQTAIILWQVEAIFFHLSSSGLCRWGTATGGRPKWEGREAGDVLWGSLGINIWHSVEQSRCSCYLQSAGVRAKWYVFPGTWAWLCVLRITV